MGRPAPARYPEHQIAPGFRGWLESPPPQTAVEDCVFVTGWAFSSGPRIVDMWADVAGDRRPLRHDLRRDDVAAAYPDEAQAGRSGFSAYIEFDRRTPGGARLEIHAALEDGRTVRLFARRLERAGRGATPFRRAVREAIAHPRTLLSPRAWATRLSQIVRASPPPRTDAIAGPATPGEAVAHAARVALASFLTSGSRLALPSPPDPGVSVIVVVWNRAELTLACLRALAAQRDVDLEVVVVDNASTDDTPALLDQVDGVRVVRNPDNVGFTVGANAGARAARGEYLLFLNNDAEVLPGAIGRLLETARRDRSIGAVGGKLVFPDGRLQEAGSIVWSDGSCDAYGRGGDPSAPEFDFERRVDFCSAALMLTRRAVFEALGGFDERYRPAYYEDADYGVRLWSRGLSVVYQPGAVAIHHEFGSALSRDAGIELQRERRSVFAARHRDWLAAQRPREGGVFAARSHPHGRRSVVLVDDVAPDRRLGAGLPRAAALVQALDDLGYLVTVYETTGEGHPSRRHDSLRGVEIVRGGPGGLRALLTSSRGHDFVIVSRPHNMQYVKAAVGSDLAVLGVPCIYDAEAVFATREVGRRQVAGRPMTDAERRASIEAELRLARGCAAVLVVSGPEGRLFEEAGHAHVVAAGHAVDPQPTATPFECRRSMLFVGAFGPDSPNDDAVASFRREALPALRRRGCAAPFVVAGARIPPALQVPADHTVAWHSDVEDLTPYYSDARVFVAPTRFAAGIPLKVIEAAARGVPVVGTALVARQLGWRAGTELLTGESPTELADAIASLFADRDLWARVREAALARVRADYNAERFRQAVAQALAFTTVA